MTTASKRNCGLLVIALIVPVSAQVVAPPSAAGYGAILREMDGIAATGNSNLNAATFLSGRFYVAGTVRAAHRIYAVNPNGTPAGSFLQPAAQLASPSGILDMTTDGVSLIGGSDQGISVFDVRGAPVGQVVAARGPQRIVNPITGPGLAAVGGTYAALTFDPAGNGGTGSFMVANGRSNIYEIDTAGNVLATLVNPGLDAAGFVGPEPCQGFHWVYSRASGQIEEMSPAGTLTGNRIPGACTGGVPGGIDVIRPYDPGTPWYNSFQIVSVCRSATPRILIHRIHGVDPIPAPIPPIPWILHGAREAFLEIGLSGTTLGRGPVGVPRGAPSITMNLNANGEPSVGVLWVLGFNAGPDTMINAYTNLGSVTLPEWVLAGPASTPAGVLTSTFSPTGSVYSLLLPPGFSPPPGALLKVQAAYVNVTRGSPRLSNLIATNAAYFVF